MDTCNKVEKSEDSYDYNSKVKKFCKVSLSHLSKVTLVETEQNRDKNGYCADRWELTDLLLIRVECVDTHRWDYPCVELITGGIKRKNWNKS